MGMQINTNVAALNTYRNLNNTQASLDKSLARLSSGLRINSAADDAAGLAISQGLSAQVSGNAVATRNAQDGVSVVQTADGALGEVQTILQRVRDLTVQYGDGANNSEAKSAITNEIKSLASEIDRITKATNFNGTSLFNGTDEITAAVDGQDAVPGTPASTDPDTGVTTPATPGTPAVPAQAAVTGTKLTFHIGAGSTANDQVSLDIKGLGAIKTALDTVASTLSGSDTTNVGTNVQTALASVDAQIKSVSTNRAELGATQNRFESAIRSLSVSTENLTAAKSRITDVDMASEMVNYSRANILSQAGTAMLAQANQSTSGVLQLLR